MAPARSPPTYTGEPDMPATMPPVSSITGPDTWIRMKSIPGAMPSVRTPSTSTSNETGVVPSTTVQAVPVVPGVKLETSTTGGGVAHRVAADVAGADQPI